MPSHHLITVGIGHLVPTDARTPVEPIISVWQEIESVFANYRVEARAYDQSKTAEYLVTLDASEVLQDLRFFAEYDGSETQLEYLHAKASSLEEKRPHVTLKFELTPTNQAALDCPHTPYRLVSLLLQEIFAVANLCYPGACNFFRTTYPEKADVSPPAMYFFYFEDCARFARDGGWPTYQTLSFATAWRWLLAGIKKCVILVEGRGFDFAGAG